VLCRISPDGQRWVSAWASNRYAANGAAVLLLWANAPEDMQDGPVSPQDARCTAVKQLQYFAGDNDKGSYMAGFGEKATARNHHRNSACAPWEQKETDDNSCSKCSASRVSPESLLSNHCKSRSRCMQYWGGV
jgi:Glycosyl hydrolase family 9